MKKMKKILNILKTFVHGLGPACTGGLVAFDAIYCVNNIVEITTHAVSGWNVVLNFILAILEFVLMILLIYELGIMSQNSNNWIAYNKAQAAQTIDSSSEECETSDETADI